MPCLIALLALITPRIIIVVLALFTNYLANAYNTLIWPVLGFFFMPLTTLAYAFAMNERGQVSGWLLALVVIAALIDVGSLGQGGRSYRGKRR